MGFWTGIKRAINSTLGTSEFEPLDKIITSHKTLVASENIYKTCKFTGSPESGDVISANCDGSIRLYGTFNLSGLAVGNSGNVIIYFYDLDNQEEITHSQKFQIFSSSNNTECYLDVNIQKGKRYTMFFSLEDAVALTTGIKANIVDGTLISVEQR